MTIDADNTTEPTTKSYSQADITAWLTERQAAARHGGDASGEAFLGDLICEWGNQSEPAIPCLDPLADIAHPTPATWRRYALIVLIWIVLLVGATLALRSGADRRLVGGGLVLAAIASHAFTVVVGLVGLIPFIGPLLIKVLSIPIIWLLNSIGYLVSMVAIRRGYSKDVLTYRGLTVALITGIVLGYILGKFV
ncbi:MAG: hypothetical protein JO142_01640 [Burkholderiales bacterium]|nr:hypothetical protein [Burkholderiales bacterium]